MSVKSLRNLPKSHCLCSVGGDNSTYSQRCSLPARSHHILLQMLLSHIRQMHSLRFRMWFWLVVHSGSDCMSEVTVKWRCLRPQKTECVRVYLCV